MLFFAGRRMSSRAYLVVLGLFVSISPSVVGQSTEQDEFTRRKARAERAQRRQEEFHRTRAYPMESLPAGARLAAVAEMERMIAAERKLHGNAAGGPAWK